MIEFIQSITDEEMNFIAHLDYGCSKDEHFQALKKVIFEQKGICNKDQSWYPAEVYELGSNSLKTGHEREFTPPTFKRTSYSLPVTSLLHSYSKATTF